MQLLLVVDLDLDVNAGREVELHQSVNGLVGRIDDVHQALMGADFELVAAGLVDVRRTQNVETLNAGGKRNGTANNSAGALGGVDDFESRLIDQLVIKRLEANADALRLHLSDFPKKKNNKRTKGAQYNHAPFPLSRVTEKFLFSFSMFEQFLAIIR